ncbi:hypothetical protein E2C01_047640 [Portunus trituberculatus]|uniref:Uncharacterized protein n=1 Tax=Portunus trituberculatus TaxID=210409 RepID=A0A5B7G1N4_PORTR|nr:hypothetical protein [Portunus trituberculatus]
MLSAVTGVVGRAARAGKGGDGAGDGEVVLPGGSACYLAGHVLPWPEGKGVVTSGVGGGTGTSRELITCRSWGHGITGDRMWYYWDRA